MLFSTQELIKAPTQSGSQSDVLSHEQSQPRKATESQESHRLKTPEELEWEVLQQSHPLWGQESLALAVEGAFPQNKKLIRCLNRLQLRAIEQEKSEQILIPEVILKIINTPQATNPLGIMATKYPHLLSQAFEPCQDLANWVEGLMVLSSQEDKIILPYHKTLINKAQQYGYEMARVIKVLTDSGVTITKNLGTTLLKTQKSLIGLHLVLKVLEDRQLTPKLIDLKTVQLLLKYHTVLFHMDRTIRARFLKYAIPSSVEGKTQFYNELRCILTTLSHYQYRGFYTLNAICQIWSYTPEILNHPQVLSGLTKLTASQHITVAKNMFIYCWNVSPALLTSQNCENIVKKSQDTNSIFTVVQKIRKQWESDTRAVLGEILTGEHDEAIVDSLKHYHGTLNEQQILEVLRGQRVLKHFESCTLISSSGLSSLSCDSLIMQSDSSEQTDCCRKRAHSDDGLNLGIQIATLTPNFNNEHLEKDHSLERKEARAVIKKIRK